MRSIVIALILFGVFDSFLSAQNSAYNIDHVLLQIEKNNSMLNALQKKSEADKIGNYTGNYLSNPEFELNYLWGTPAATGNRTDLRIHQSFDFPTAYQFRKQISSIKNAQVELEYQRQRQELLLYSGLILYDLIYTNALLNNLSLRIQHAQSIAGSFKAKFEIGETNILEYNKAQFNLLNLNKRRESLSIEKDGMLGELARLNGGMPVVFEDDEFPPTTIPADFDQWYAQAEQQNPTFSLIKKEVELSHKQVSLRKALSLPVFHAGYMSESVVRQEFQGITVGMSIPLWENKNSVRYAKASAVAKETAAAGAGIQLYNYLKVLHAKAISLQNNVEDYKIKLESFNNIDLLNIALDKGQITLIEYMLELSIYNESINTLLELERDLHKSLAELNRYGVSFSGN